MAIWQCMPHFDFWQITCFIFIPIRRLISCSQFRLLDLSLDLVSSLLAAGGFTVQPVTAGAAAAVRVIVFASPPLWRNILSRAACVVRLISWSPIFNATVGSVVSVNLRLPCGDFLRVVLRHVDGFGRLSKGIYEALFAQIWFYELLGWQNLASCRQGCLTGWCKPIEARLHGAISRILVFGQNARAMTGNYLVFMK